MAQSGQLTPPPPSVSQPSGVQRAVESSEKKDDSGIVDLAAAAASDPHASERAQTTPLASAGLFDDEPHSVRPGPVAQPVPTIPPMPASMPPASQPVASAAAPISSAPVSAAAPSASAPMAALASQSAPTAAQPEKKGGGGKVIAGVFAVVALAAAAAGGFVVLKGHQAKTAAEAVAMNDTKPAPKADTTPAPTQTAPIAEAPAAPSEPGTDLNALPTAADSKSAKITPRATGGARPAAAAKAEPAAAKPDAPKEEPKVAQKDIPQATGPVGALGDEMRKAVGANENQTPAAGPAGGGGPAAGTVPQKPSQGAITGALGAVLPEARRCLGPDDPISRASVVFGSNGTVQSVSVSGGAVGKPAEACIKGALMKAKVAPFAEATYSAPVTIRH